MQSEKRFRHSENVSIESARLAKKFGENILKAKIAGILHDITKEMPLKNQLQILDNNNIELDNIQLEVNKLWHAISGSIYIKNFLNISDEDIINAVRYHTTGRTNMSLLEKIIFVADFTSMERNFEGVSNIREATEKNNIDFAVVKGLIYSLKNNIQQSKILHPDTINAYNYILIDRKSIFNEQL